MLEDNKLNTCVVPVSKIWICILHIPILGAIQTSFAQQVARSNMAAEQQQHGVGSTVAATTTELDVTEDHDVAPGEATLLVSEFPPPPFYYKLFGGSTASAQHPLAPPPIPTEALERGTRRAAAAAARARAAEERQRLLAMGQPQQSGGDDKNDPTQNDTHTDAVLGGAAPDAASQEEEGDVVAVFGEIVEDPLLVEPLDNCEDPMVICNEVKRLNRSVLQGFVRLVQDLVHRPLENKYVKKLFCVQVALVFGELSRFLPLLESASLTTEKQEMYCLTTFF
jgi:hypothetical protein